MRYSFDSEKAITKCLSCPCAAVVSSEISCNLLDCTCTNPGNSRNGNHCPLSAIAVDDKQVCATFNIANATFVIANDKGDIVAGDTDALKSFIENQRTIEQIACEINEKRKEQIK
jgi:hypothetical protein